MSPEDDPQTDRIPNIEHISSHNRVWNPIATTNDTPQSPTTKNLNNGHSTSTTATPQPASNTVIVMPKLNGNTANGTSTASTTNGGNVAVNNNKNSNGQQWSTDVPLLQNSSTASTPHTEDSSGNHKTTNNNDVWSTSLPVNSSTGLPRAEKNGWKELPQDEEESRRSTTGIATLNGGSNGNGVANGNGISNGQNGHSDKLAEQDPLTGIVLKDVEEDEQSTCGIGACQPKWARSLASTKSFMCVFLVAWVLQGMYFTYIVSVITTIEKLFQIKSKTSGMLLSVTEVGQICTALLLTYFAGQGHRPRWIACGMFLFAICAFGCSIPHFMFGSELQSGTTGSVGSLSVNHLENRSSFAEDNSNLCRASENGSKMFDSGCAPEQLGQQEAHSQITYTVLAMLVFCMLGVGVGQTAVATLGIPFIDDNVASRESPIYIAITIGVRILGPTSGFMLGSICTRLHVDLTDPGYGPDDSRWIGAWYLGLVIIPTLMIFAAIAMFTFPRHLRGNRIPPPIKMRAIENAKKLEKHVDETKPRLKDFPKTIKRQLNNDILMFRTASSVLHLLPVAGLYTFLPKYLESQFRMAAHESSMITGIYGILVMGVGIVISGVVILKFSPTARSVAAYIAFTAFVYSAGMAVLMFTGCTMDDFVGLKAAPSVSTDIMFENRFEPPCIFDCKCDFDKFSPICGSDGLTYFSSCHAGCQAASVVNGKTQYSNCTCIPDFAGHEFNATPGYCDDTCKSYLMFISLFSFLVFMHSTSEVGSMLLIMRCTDPKDKAMAMGIIQFAIGLFGNVPCPIIYGAVIDSTCLVWEMLGCGSLGACKQYDKDAFRHFFFGTTSGIMFLAFIMDLVVWRKAHRIDIDPENHSSTSDIELEKQMVTTIVPDSTV